MIKSTKSVVKHILCLSLYKNISLEEGYDMDRLNNLSSRMEELVNASRLNTILSKREDDEKKKNTIIWVLAIIGAIAAVAGIAFAVYKFFTPDYLEDFEDDFDDDFDYDFDDETEE